MEQVIYVLHIEGDVVICHIERNNITCNIQTQISYPNVVIKHEYHIQTKKKLIELKQKIISMQKKKIILYRELQQYHYRNNHRQHHQ